MAWKVIGRHKWVSGATITESYDVGKERLGYSYRRFTATIMGWRNFLIYEGKLKVGVTKQVIKRVKEIRDRIERGDEGVFRLKRLGGKG